MATLRPSAKPASPKRRWNPAIRSVHCAADTPCSTPITGIAGCCARAASGQAAALPSSVMKSRRFTASASRASKRKDSTPSVWQQTAAVRDFDRYLVRL
jgi:hypothetical protein